MTPVSNRAVQTLVLLVCILAVNLAGLIIFQRGFLLSRPVFDDNFAPHDQLFTPPLFDRAVILVVDALRYDFASLPHKDFTTLSEYAHLHPKNSVLLKFVADPPTTTLQRLKGLTTGSLPTFIDAGSNFAGTAILEDNWVDLLRKNNQTLAFVGDDTWSAIYPDQFEFCQPYPSLEVNDLDTVDNGVKTHLSSLVSNSSYTVVVGHMLGVDHAGHTYGPEHRRMGAKLRETDEYIQSIIPLIDDRTLFMVFGDHGMDSKGDHGGDSQLELDAALWMYSTRPVFDAKSKSHVTSVSQIDLVPTLCLALGYAPPFNNLGFPINVFANKKELSKWETITADQIEHYAKNVPELESISRSDYTSNAEFQATVLDALRDIWVKFDSLSMVFGIVVLSISFFMILLLIIGYGVAPDFFVFGSTMIWTACMAGFGAFMGIVGASNLGALRTAALLFVLNIGAYIMYLSACALMGPQSEETAVATTSTATSESGDSVVPAKAATDLTVPPPSGPSLLGSNWRWTLFAGVAVVLHAMSQSSNSFIIWESTLINHLLNLFVVLALLACVKAPVKSKGKRSGKFGRPVLMCVAFALLTKITSMSVLCREEHGPTCNTTFYAKGSSVSPVIYVALIGVAIILFPMALFSFYSSCQSLWGPARLWRFATGIVLLLSLAYWALSYAFDVDAASNLTSIKIVISRIGLGVSLVAANYLWAKSDLCVQIVIDHNSVPRLQGYSNVYGGYFGLLVLNVVAAVLLVSKPTAVIVLLGMTLQVFCLSEICHYGQLKKTPVPAVVSALLAMHYFYATGHQATIPSVQWDVAFMASRTIVFPLAHIILVLNSLGTLIIGVFAAALIPLWKQPPAKNHEIVARRAMSSVLVYIAYFALLTLCTSLYAGLLRRHLMVWKIFAPRFMLGAVSLPTVMVSGLLACLGVWVAVGKVAKVYS